MECSEKICAPVLVLLSIVVDIIPLCCRNWIEGYYGDVTAVMLCPWRLCHLSCLRCTREKPTITCFWIQDWSDTGFETFGVVAHLEYWSLGFLTAGCIASLFDWVESHLRRRLGCPFRFSKASLALIITGSLISTLSVSLFGVKLDNSVSKIADFDDVRLKFAWPFIARVVSVLLAWGATAAAICNHCKMSMKTAPVIGNVRVVMTDPDYEDDYADEAENGTLL